MFTAQPIIARRVGSASISGQGSIASGRRRTGYRSASGAMGRIWPAALSRLKRNEPDRLKNSGASVTPRTDLNPNPNLPISTVPRLGDRCENMRAFRPSGSIARPSSAQ